MKPTTCTFKLVIVLSACESVYFFPRYIVSVVVPAVMRKPVDINSRPQWHIKKMNCQAIADWSAVSYDVTGGVVRRPVTSEDELQLRAVSAALVNGW